MNFFLFDVLKDINVIMPEENVDTKRVINLCFDNKEIFNISKYRITANMTLEYEPFEYSPSMMKQIAESLTVQERFNITDGINWIHFKDKTIGGKNYIIASLYCNYTKYQDHVVIKRSLWEMISSC